jgi:hypothetical protein
MPRRNKIVRTDAIQGYMPLTEITEVSRETKRARKRSEYGAGHNTLANRRWGGSAITTGFRPEEHAGAARISPVTSTVKTRDESGITLPKQHMTATRKRHERDGSSPKSGKIARRGRKQDAPFTRFESEDAHIRDITRDKHAQRDVDETR